MNKQHTELNKLVNEIKTLGIRLFTLYILKHTPSSFWVMPATTNNLFHTLIARREFGLIHHTKFAFKMAQQITLAHGVRDIRKDIVLSSILLHDIMKYDNNSTYVLSNHAVLASLFINKMADNKYGSIYPKYIYDIISCVRKHMGKYLETFTVNFTSDLLFMVHLADTLASLRCTLFYPERI